MQKSVWIIGLLISIALAQTEFGQLPGSSLVLGQAGILSADSSTKVINYPSDDVATDVLQETLYAQIVSEINNPQLKSSTKQSENKHQLLQRCQSYYPRSIIRSDTLIIPYPPQKVDRFKEVKYIIPEEYFKNNNDFISLQPHIQLYLNPDKSTIMMNNSFLLSFYRTPAIINSSLQQYKKVLQYVYNLLLPYTIINRTQVGNIHNAIIYYKGYKEHEIKLESERKFYAFWESLCGQGSLYFFPSKIDDLETNINVYGLLYVMKDDIVNAYHFGELKVTFSKKNLNEIDKLQLDFYPFIKNKQIGN